MENISIVGAGLVGSLISVYLARLGFKVSIYERSADPRQIQLQSNRSVNITLSKRGFQALDAIGIGNKIRKFCVPVYGRIIHAKNSELTYQPYGNNQEALYSIRRADLSKILLNFAESQKNVEFYFNYKCHDVELQTATLTLQNLETGQINHVQSDRIIAADGAYSAVRQKMQRLKGFNYAQEYYEHGYKEIIIPADRQGNWSLDKNALHIWPRDQFMLIGFPNIDKSFTLSLHLPLHGEVSHDSISSTQDLDNLFKTYFPDIWTLVKPNLCHYFENPMETMITIKCFPWSYQDKVILIGDACHAILPSYGQGANAGFEDCLLLIESIQQYSTNWEMAFKKYEAQRKPNMDAIAELCVEHFMVLRNKVGDSQFLETKKMERKLQEIYPKYAPLYYNIAFTNMPYLEALKTEKFYQNIIAEMKNECYNFERLSLQKPEISLSYSL